MRELDEKERGNLQEEHKKSLITEHQKEMLDEIDEEELARLVLMIKESFVPDTEYFTLNMGFESEFMQFFQTYKQAENELIDICTSTGGKNWVQMSNTELEEWIEFL